MVVLNNPEAPATVKQLYKLRQLTGNDMRGLKLTMQQASDKIEDLQFKKLTLDTDITDIDLNDDPFSEVHCSIVEGDQRSGKTVYSVAKIRDSYDKDCGRIFCEDYLKIACEVKAYYRYDRIIKIKHENAIKLIQLPNNYRVYSPMRIFSNIHLYGIPYVYIPSFRHMLDWLKSGFICKGWLLSDESHQGMSARNGMSSMGREWVGQYYQFGKSELDVIMITHHARMIDFLARLVPTQRIHCRYDPKTFKVHYTLRKKGEQGEKEHSFFAPQYWGNYRTNEKVNG